MKQKTDIKPCKINVQMVRQPEIVFISSTMEEIGTTYKYYKYYKYYLWLSYHFNVNFTWFYICLLFHLVSSLQFHVY